MTEAEARAGTGTGILVAIDPSINSLGYAIFYDDTLTTWGTIKSDTNKRQDNLESRIQYTLSKLALVIPSGPIKLIVEEPQAFASSTSSAAVHNNSLKKLLMMVGAVVWHAYIIKADLELIPVGRWKGQLPKSVTKTRMEAKYKVEFKTTDECDAVGLGDWYLTKAQNGTD